MNVAVKTKPSPDTANPTMRHGAITAVVCLALAAVTAAMSSLNVALPDIARSTHASQTQLSWIIDAYSLTFAALLLPGGALGDRYGRRRLLLIGLTIFGIGSAAAMTASDANVLIALRAVIGLGAALVMPATLSTITGTFPPAQRVKAVSIWAGVAGGAAVLGVVASGALLEAFSWRSVFGVNVVLGVIALIGTFIIVPESADKDAPRLDLAGAVLSVAGLVAVVYSIIEAPTAGWLAARTLIGLALGLLVLVAFVLVELRLAHPMLDPRVFTHRRLSAGSLSIFVQFFVFYGFIFLVLQYLQIVRRDSALVAAVCMLPMAVTMMPTSRLAPKLADRFGSRAVCVDGPERNRYRPRRHLTNGRAHRVLAPRHRAADPGRGNGGGDDARHQRNHQRVAEVAAGRRVGHERSVPRGRRRTRDRRSRQRRDGHLPRAPEPARPARLRGR